MELLQGKEFIGDFAKRTRENLLAYKGEYEVTQMLNSVIGILIIPKERDWGKISDKMIPSNMLCELQMCIRKNGKKNLTDKEKKTIHLNDIIYHLRNASAHAFFAFEKEIQNRKGEDLPIANIIFADCSDDTVRKSARKRKNGMLTEEEADFWIQIPVELLYKFLMEFADVVAKEYIKQGSVSTDN